MPTEAVLPGVMLPPCAGWSPGLCWFSWCRLWWPIAAGDLHHGNANFSGEHLTADFVLLYLPITWPNCGEPKKRKKVHTSYWQGLSLHAHSFSRFISCGFVGKKAFSVFLRIARESKGEDPSGSQRPQKPGSASAPFQPPELRVCLPGWPRRRAASLGICVFIGLSFHVWKPVSQIYPASTPGCKTQLWAKEQYAKDAIFITPPQLWCLRTGLARLFRALECGPHNRCARNRPHPEYLDVWLPALQGFALGLRAV